MASFSVADSTRRFRLVSRFIGLVCLWICGATDASSQTYSVSPPIVSLRNPESSQQLLVWENRPAGESTDRTRDATYDISPPGIATVDGRGLIRPLADGNADLMVTIGEHRLTIPIDVDAFASPPPVSFRNEILPLLTKSHCNSGGCHGKAEGQNGLKLSVFGFDPVADYQAIVSEGRGRRISPAKPSNSLFYQKGLAMTPHGGGQKIEPGSYRAMRLLRWIGEGATFETETDDQTATIRIEVEPKLQQLTAGQTQQLRVTAVDATGRRHCVTAISEFESNASVIADADPSGLVRATDVPGEAAILVRYAGQLAVCRVTLPRPGVVVARFPENNFVDRLVLDQLQRLGIEPSERCDDEAFLRRVFLDTIGTLPTMAETREFLTDTRDDKRERMVDHLLDRPEYVDYWTMKWLNLLRADHLAISPQGVVAMRRWLRRSLETNQPFDEFARELVTVQGNTSAVGPGSIYKVLPKPDEVARSLSQLLLGVRIECAQCHHHPSERWGQEDYVALAGFFTGVSLKKLPNGEQAILSRGGADLPNPRTGQPVAARALGEPPADFSDVSDRRVILADWMTSPDNPYFAKAIANRIWAHYFGRGLIEPIDDMRQTNPPSNEPLMAALEDHLRQSKYDLKAFTRKLLLSQTYQLSSDANGSNVDDDQNFSRASYKTLPAEVLLDAICQVTGTTEKFNGFPDGYRAIEVWDNRLPSYFFKIFGRPVRATVCECERSDEPSIAQALHLLNAPEITEKIEHRHGHVIRLATSELSPTEIITELYLATLSRHPTPPEIELMRIAFADSPGNQTAAGESPPVDQNARIAATEDVLWALLNSKEFLFNH